MDEHARLHPTVRWEETPAATPTAVSGLLGALPDGWVMLGRCRVGTAGPATYPTGCWALAHPATGVALVDIAPDATPNAESRLRRALGAANFWPAFPGYLPVWHGRIELAAWRSLPGIMAEGFSELPPLTVPGKGAWIAATREALAADPAWEVPGAAGRRAAPALPADLEEDEPEPAAAQRWRLPGRAPLLLGFAATFALGLASGVLLLSGTAPAPGPAAAPAAAVMPVAALPPPRELVRPAPEPMQAVPVAAPAPPVAMLPTVTPPPVREAERPAPEPVQALPQAAPPAMAPLPETVAAVPPAATPDVAGSDAGEPVETASAALPLPPLAPKAPPARAARPPERIDRACSQALYRFQQGERLTAQDAAYLRDGCATTRR